MFRRLVGSRLARLFAGTLAAGIVARLVLLALTVVLSRHLSPQGYGAFIFATGTAALIAQFSTLGWPALMSRLIPGFAATEQFSKLRGLVWAGDIVVLIGSLVATIAIGAFIYFFVADHESTASLTMSQLLIVPLAFSMLRRNQLAGAKNASFGITLDQTLPPLLVLVVALTIGIQNIGEAISIMFAGTVLSVVIGTVVLRRSVDARVWSQPGTIELGKWFGTALPLILGLSSKVAMNRIDILMLAPLADLIQVGLYGTAFRISYAVSFPQLMLMQIITPLLAEALAKRNSKQLWRYFWFSVIFAAASSIPIGVFISVYATEVIQLLFGSDFSAATTPLAILGIGTCFAALCIPCAGLLIAAGMVRQYAFINMSALGLNVALNFLLIPQFGASGTAWASLVSVFITFVAQALALFIRRNRLFENLVY